MAITFERATLDDAEDLVKAEVAAFHHDAVMYPGVELSGPPGYDSVDVMRQKIQDDDCYTITSDGTIIGGMVVNDTNDGHVHLDLIFIDPSYHSRGIGTQAMQFMEQTHPATRWTLDTPGYATRNHHFYEKQGYVKIKEEAYPEIVLFSYEKQAT